MVIATPLHRCQAKRRKAQNANSAITSISTDSVDFSPSPHPQSKKQGTDGDRKENITHSSEKYTRINHRRRAVTRTAQQGAALQDAAQTDPRQMAFVPRKFNSAGQLNTTFPSRLTESSGGGYNTEHWISKVSEAKRGSKRRAGVHTGTRI